MNDDQKRPGVIDCSATGERSDRRGDARPTGPAVAATVMAGKAADTGIADATNRPLLSRNSMQQPRKSLFRR